MAMLRRSVGAVWLGVLLGAGAMAGAQPQASPFVAPQSATPVKAEAFSSPEVAAAALIAAARADNVAVMHTILGPESVALLYSGDPVADAEARRKFVTAYDAHHALARDARGRMILSVGANEWPLPIPIVQEGGQWHFDSLQGAQDLIDRRIGRNEIAAIRTSLAYVDAQKLYFTMAPDQGQASYAERLVSRPGRRDGLYWPTQAGEPDSPLEPLIEQATDEGYPGANASGKPIPYQGYYFRILRGQGDDAPGGALDYVANGRMTKGFALIAWPAIYGASGIMSFEVNQDDIVFQKDLGPDTASVVSGVRLFNPDLSWVRVDIVGQ